MKKTYDFNYDFHEATAKFEVDTEIFTDDMAKATLEFFCWDYDEEADPVDEVLKKYTIEAIREATDNNHNTYGVIQDFKRKEGFAPVDGSTGIKLLDVRLYEFDESKLTVEINQLAD